MMEANKYSYKTHACPICEKKYIAKFYEGKFIGSEYHNCRHFDEIIKGEVEQESPIPEKTEVTYRNCVR